MKTISQILEVARSIKDSTAWKSITATKLGQLLVDITDYLSGVDKNANAMSVRKTYGTYEDMVADTYPVYEVDGVEFKLKFGQHVSVTNDGNDNGLYRFLNPGWDKISGLGDIVGVSQELGDSTTAVVSQKTFTESIQKAVEMIAHNASAPSPVIPTGTTKTYEFSSGGLCTWLANQVVEKGDKATVAFTAPSTFVRTYQDVVSRKVDDAQIKQVVGTSETDVMSQKAVTVITNELSIKTTSIEDNIVNNDIDVTTTYSNKTIGSNLVLSDNVLFKYSAPVFMNSGDRIVLYGQNPSTFGENAFDSFWVLAKSNGSGILEAGIIRGQIAEKLMYTATTPCYVVFSVRTSAFIKAAIYSSTLSENIGQNSEDIARIEKSLAAPVKLLDYGYYNTYAAIEGVASLVFTENTGWYSKKIEVKKGDVFYITGTGGGTPLLWINCTIDKIVKSKSDQSASESMKRIMIVTDGFFVCNFNRAQNYALYKVTNQYSTLSSDYVSRFPKLYTDPISQIRSLGLTGIIHKWGFIGDSLASGYIDNVNASNYDYSWGQRMCAILGVEGYNFSAGGMTAKSWIYNNDGATYDTNRIWSGAKTNIKQSYIIALGVNDRANLVTQSPGYYQVGDVNTDIGVYDTNTDTDTNAETFVGYYAGIIQRIKSVQANAPIFLCTLPILGSSVNDFNAAISGIATKFTNIHVLDMALYAPDFEDQEFKKMFFGTGHMNAMGYEWYAYCIIQYIDWVMRNNYTAFKDVNMLQV